MLLIEWPAQIFYLRLKSATLSPCSIQFEQSLPCFFKNRLLFFLFSIVKRWFTSNIRFPFLHFSLEQMHGNAELADVDVACLQEPDAVSVLQHLLRFV